MPNLAGVLVDSSGVLQCSVGGAIAGYSGGWPPWPLGSDGTVRCVSDTGQSRVYAGGFAFDTSGYLIISSGGSPAGYIGAIGVTTTGAVCLDTTGGSIVGYAGGLGLTALARASATGLFNPNLYLLEILSTRSGAPAWTSATGTLTANSGQTVSCSRASSAYCRVADDANGERYVLLGANTVRVEPTGLLVEGPDTNLCWFSQMGVNDAPAGHGWNTFGASVAVPAITLNTTDVVDPLGGNAATKLVFSAVSVSGDYSAMFDASVGPPSGQGCASMWLRAPAGQSFTLVFSNNGHATTVTITDKWVRYTVPIGFGQVWLGNYFNTLGAQPARTVYVWGCSASNLTFAPSLAFSSGAQASRDGDFVTVNMTPIWGALPVKPFRMQVSWASLWTDASLVAPYGSTQVSLLDWATSEPNRTVFFGDTGGANGVNFNILERDSGGGGSAGAVFGNPGVTTGWNTPHVFKCVDDGVNSQVFVNGSGGALGTIATHTAVSSQLIIGAQYPGGTSTGQMGFGHFTDIIVNPT